MKRIFIICIGMVMGLLASDAHSSGPQSVAGRADPSGDALLNQYCITCHNQRVNTAELALDTMDLLSVGDDAQAWERVVRKLRTGMMPPVGARRPDRAVLDSFASELETRLDQAADLAPNPGAPALARLNRTEYANAVRDLLDLEIDVTTLLPGDESSQGFDNIAEALSVSPALAQGYVSSAMKISRLAVGDRAMLPSQIRYGVAGLEQDGHIDGLPLGTRGGMLIEHTFPLDGEYDFSVGGNNFTLDSEKIEVQNFRNFRLSVTAGPHTMGAFLVDQRRPAGVDDLWSVARRGRGGAPGITITGPFNATGPGDLPSRRRIFVCFPESAGQNPDAAGRDPRVADQEELSCARQIIGTLARRAFRRSVEDAQIDRLMRFYENGRAEDDFEAGVERAVAGLLVSPGFMFRSEDEPAGLPAGGVYPVDDVALASRLSFFLWSSIPDDELLDIALEGRLSDPMVLEQQMLRMLRDPKSDALTDNFAGQWLQLRALDQVDPLLPLALANRVRAGGFNENLRQAFRKETEMLFESVAREDRSIIDLIDADYTFVDEQLARHYDIPDVTGSYFRRVELDADSPRRGLLGHGSILTLTSAPNRTSPVVRGQWILENILGSPAPDPPPGVETDLEEDPEALEKQTLRERLEAHRADAVCSSCHQIMDPIGLALENFDQIGKWREFDGEAPIDASGRLVDGTQLTGVLDLREALMDRSGAFVTTAVEKLMTYALGRPVDYYDMPAVRLIVREAEDDNFRFSSLLLGIIKSVPFQTKMKTGEDVPRETGVAVR
jgi:hypothetical protein